jgi:hypothetical protein
MIPRRWKALFAALSALWYLAGAVLLYALWTDSFSLVARDSAAAAARLEDCLRQVHSGRSPDTAESPESNEKRVVEATLTESACQEAYRQALPAEKPSEADRPYFATLIVLCVPALLYAASRLLLVYE